MLASQYQITLECECMQKAYQNIMNTFEYPLLFVAKDTSVSLSKRVALHMQFILVICTTSEEIEKKKHEKNANIFTFLGVSCLSQFIPILLNNKFSPHTCSIGIMIFNNISKKKFYSINYPKKLVQEFARTTVQYTILYKICLKNYFLLIWFLMKYQQLCGIWQGVLNHPVLWDF